MPNETHIMTDKELDEALHRIYKGEPPKEANIKKRIVYDGEKIELKPVPAEPSTIIQPKRRGRPPGSKNKPKEVK